MWRLPLCRKSFTWHQRETREGGLLARGCQPSGGGHVPPRVLPTLTSISSRLRIACRRPLAFGGSGEQARDRPPGPGAKEGLDSALEAEGGERPSGHRTELSEQAQGLGTWACCQECAVGGQRPELLASAPLASALAPTSRGSCHCRNTSLSPTVPILDPAVAPAPGGTSPAPRTLRAAPRDSRLTQAAGAEAVVGPRLGLGLVAVQDLLYQLLHREAGAAVAVATGPFDAVDCGERGQM